MQNCSCYYLFRTLPWLLSTVDKQVKPSSQGFSFHLDRSPTSYQEGASHTPVLFPSWGTHVSPRLDAGPALATLQRGHSDTCCAFPAVGVGSFVLWRARLALCGRSGRPEARLSFHCLSSLPVGNTRALLSAKPGFSSQLGFHYKSISLSEPYSSSEKINKNKKRS